MTILTIVAMFLKIDKLLIITLFLQRMRSYLARSDVGQGIIAPYIRMYSTNHFILISELANDKIYDIADPNCFDKLYKDLAHCHLPIQTNENPMDD